MYSYHSSRNLTIRPLNTIAVDLNPDEDALPNFASVNRATIQSATYFTIQKVTLVMDSAEQIRNSCVVNFNNSQSFNFSFNLNLIDSSDGQVVCSQNISIHNDYAYCIIIYVD